jgi:IS5 family transposase
MIADFDDFCTWMYVLIDDLWQPLRSLCPRPGPQPACSDSEVMTMAIVGECRGWDMETNLISEWQTRRHLFPQGPERTRFNRRRRHLSLAFNLIRQAVLRVLDLAQDRQCVIDSLPVSVVEFHLVPTASREWAAAGAAFGKVSTKQQTIYGYKRHLLMTLGGLILDFVLAPANAHDGTVGVELLEEHTHLTVIGDKAYIHAARAAELRASQGLDLLTLPRANQTRQVSTVYRRRLNQARQIIETVNGQLAGQFQVETNHAHRFAGLWARLYTKLAAHTLCIYLNRLLGNRDSLQIKGLAFPI